MSKLVLLRGQLPKVSRYQWILLLYTSVLAVLFAMVEIQIEGSGGWAQNLPTWRVEKQFLLDIFWGGRAMTGYHFWIFPFMFLIFHLPLVFAKTFSLEMESRIIGCLTLFWLIEDFLWFVLNPAYGLAKFSPEFIPWHPRWLLGLPADYIYFGSLGIFLLFIFKRKSSLY